MKERIISYGSSLLGLAETAVICIHLVRRHSLPTEAVIFIMAAASGLLIFSFGLIDTFSKIERSLPAATANEIDLRSTAFRQLHDLFLVQSTVSAISFLYLGAFGWTALPLAKEAVLCVVQMRLRREDR